MPCICYAEKRLSSASLALIDTANTIIKDYAAQGYSITLRQLYYQLVSRDYIENTEPSYKRVGSIIADARMAGLVDWKAIEDRTRNLRERGHWSSPQQIVRACASQYREDLWGDQDYYVEVWVEKVVEAACNPLDVPHFSCRGYTSASEMWAASQRLGTAGRMGRKPVVIHLGDHDPSGIDMTRDIEERLNLFAANGELDSDSESQITVERIALNMDQVEEYGPPPNPAKTTDARYTGYERLYGDESWELDALEPRVLANLITRQVQGYIDTDRWNVAIERMQAGRKTLAAAADTMGGQGA
jgi:hypothetical protein